MKSSEICLMSKEGERLAKKSGAMVKWNETYNGSEITSAQLDGDPWKTRWSKLRVGDRPKLSDWATDLPAGYDDDPDDLSQVAQEKRHAGDDDEEEDEDERKKRLLSEAGQDADVRILKKLLARHFDRKRAPAKDRRSVAMDAAMMPAYRNPNLTVGEAMSAIKSHFVDRNKNIDRTTLGHWVAIREFLTHFDSETPMRFVNKTNTVDAQLRHLEAKLN
jgi:hypothetical protein